MEQLDVIYFCKTKAQALDVLKNLEFHLKTLHFKPEWKQSQLIWRGKFSKTTEKTDIVLLLKELEANMQLTAFEKTWSTDREAWLLDVDKYLKKQLVYFLTFLDPLI